MSRLWTVAERPFRWVAETSFRRSIYHWTFDVKGFTIS
jgi:hypothetical protein